MRSSLLPRRRQPVALAVSILLLSFSTASPGVSFDDALRQAVEHAPLLRARASQIAAAQEDAARAGALPDPQLTLGVANWPVTGSDAFDLRADDMTMKQIGFAQEFPARAKREARRLVADRMTEQARSLSVAEQSAVRQAAAQAWIALWAAQQELTALQALREPSSDAVRAASARLGAGNGTASDALALQAAALELENRIDAADAARESARAGLARWRAAPATDADVDIDASGAPPDLSHLPLAPAALLASVDRHGALLPWPAREALADAELAAAIAEKRPDWSLAMSYGQRARMPDGRSRSDMLMLEVGIGLPLFARDRQDRGIAARRAEREAIDAEHEAARRTQTETVQKALAEWEGLKRQIARKETEALPLARDRTRTALAAYAAGAELQPWLQARRDEIELEVEHARHLGELGRVWASLAFLLTDTEVAP